MKIDIKPLSIEKHNEALDLIVNSGLDTREEVEHHLDHIDAHFIALDDDKIIGVIGWYQDNVHYADKVMGDKFPGQDAYWVGFFAVDKNYRGQGIGTDLMKKLEEVVKEKGASNLWVSSVPESVSYYKKHGFREVMKGVIDQNQKTFLIKKI